MSIRRRQHSPMQRCGPRLFLSAPNRVPTRAKTYHRAVESYQGLSGGYLLHQALVDVGVKHIFGYSGGANLPVLDAFHDSPIEFIMNRSEQCCGHAAQGYAKASGACGVVLTTSGPGLTNIITPLQDAKGDSTPMVALSGQVPLAAVGSDAFQECLAVDLTRPCTKWSYQIKSVEEVRSVVHEAFHVAASATLSLARPLGACASGSRGAAVARRWRRPQAARARPSEHAARAACEHHPPSAGHPG